MKALSRKSSHGIDAKMQYFTGLQLYEILVLDLVFEFVTNELPDSFAVSAFDQFPFVMMCLCLNVGVHDLGY